jgi:RNA polymerase sigma-70 factor, ECF subfamily
MTGDYEDLRPLLMSLAYRMVGSVSEAEDIVQEAFVRFHRATADNLEVHSPRAYLRVVTTRLAIDHLRSARVQQESYVGPWLPEPLVEDMDPSVAPCERLADSLSSAFLLVLETLSPVERAVFLLREAFAYDYDEIAAVVDKSPANCRQIAVRARRRVEAGRPRYEASPAQRDELGRRFLAAASDGRLDDLVELLAEDVTFYGDGGAGGGGFPRPIRGRERVRRLLVSVVGRMLDLGFDLPLVRVGGQPGLLLRDRDSRLYGVWSLHAPHGSVAAVYGVVNPEKLTHLGSLSDLHARPDQEASR